MVVDFDRSWQRNVIHDIPDGVAAAAVAAVAQSSSSSRRGSSIINSVRVFPRERSPEREEQELRAPTRSRPLASLSPESCCVRTSSRSIARARPRARAAARAHFYRARAICALAPATVSGSGSAAVTAAARQQV